MRAWRLGRLQGARPPCAPFVWGLWANTASECSAHATAAMGSAPICPGGEVLACVWGSGSGGAPWRRRRHLKRAHTLLPSALVHAAGSRRGPWMPRSISTSRAGGSASHFLTSPSPRRGEPSPAGPSRHQGGMDVPKEARTPEQEAQARRERLRLAATAAAVLAVWALLLAAPFASRPLFLGRPPITRRAGGSFYEFPAAAGGRCDAGTLAQGAWTDAFLSVRCERASRLSAVGVCCQRRAPQHPPTVAANSPPIAQVHQRQRGRVWQLCRHAAAALALQRGGASLRRTAAATGRGAGAAGGAAPRVCWRLHSSKPVRRRAAPAGREG